MSQDQNNEPTPETLRSVQEVNLKFLEGYFSGIKVADVPILQCVNYKTIQVVNNLGLQDLLKKEGVDAEAVNDA